MHFVRDNRVCGWHGTERVAESGELYFVTLSVTAVHQGREAASGGRSVAAAAPVASVQRTAPLHDSLRSPHLSQFRH